MSSTTLYGREPLDTVDGGTVAALALLQEELGVETATLGFAGDDENAHGADERHRIASLERGCSAYRLLLDRLAARHLLMYLHYITYISH